MVGQYVIRPTPSVTAASAPATEPAGGSEPTGPPLFADATAASGVDFTYRNGEETADHLSILDTIRP